jgi:hypothetical protein
MGALMKTQILAALGEDGLQSASALNAGLAANDRIKYGSQQLQRRPTHDRSPANITSDKCWRYNDRLVSAPG